MFDNESYLKNRPYHLCMSFLIGAAVASWASWYYTTILRKPYTSVICDLNNDDKQDVIIFNQFKRPYIFLGTEHGLKLVENTYAPENAHLLKKVKELKLEEKIFQ